MPMFDAAFATGRIRNEPLQQKLEFLREHGVGMKQLTFELDLLFDYMVQMGRGNNRCLVELGSWRGGTAWVLALFVQPGSKIILVDKFEKAVDRKKTRLVASKLSDLFEVHVLDMTTEKALPKVTKLVGDKLDHLHIDADHRYRGVAWDYHHYSPLVQAGGIVQLHDIKAVGFSTPQYRYGVHKLWDELKRHHPRTHEFVDESYTDSRATMSGHVGIGIVEV